MEKACPLRKRNNPTEVNSEFIVVPNEDKTRVDVTLFFRLTAPSVFIEIKAVGQLQCRIRVLN